MPKKLCKENKKMIKADKLKYECEKCGLRSEKAKKLCNPIYVK